MKEDINDVSAKGGVQVTKLSDAADRLIANRVKRAKRGVKENRKGRKMEQQKVVEQRMGDIPKPVNNIKTKSHSFDLLLGGARYLSATQTKID